ncbi:Transposase IS4 [Pelomyxa schiedti]|nr:Transposase IS4 [Pelomyxa schiedti]
MGDEECGYTDAEEGLASVMDEDVEDVGSDQKLILVAPWEHMTMYQQEPTFPDTTATKAWWDQIVIQTNHYAKQHLTHAWHPTSSAEVKKFFGVLLFMSQVRLPCVYTGYWDHKLYAQQAVKTSGMTRFRFYQMKKYLHLDDYTEFSAAEKTDKAFKLQREFQRFTSRVNKVWVSGVHVNIDEGMVKGEQCRHPCKKTLQGEHPSLCTTKGVGFAATTWKDHKPVYVLSGVHNETVQPHTTHRRGDPIKAKIPNCVEEYNRYHSCCDVLNASREKVDLQLRFNRWWLRVFFNGLFGTAFVNSWNVKKFDNPATKTTFCTLLGLK